MGASRERRRQELLLRVEKPASYLGAEMNAVRKDPATVALRLALVFPDLHELALGNLGLQILQSILNRIPWVWAERAYAPGLDMENELRQRGWPLFALESGDPLSDFHGIGFTLQSELTYTNILNLLDLAQLPLRAAQRHGRQPLIFAGGPTAFNPEPLAPFMDFFVLGDGEEVIGEIARTMREHGHRDREGLLEALARIEGIYVPRFHPVRALPDGTLVPEEGARRIVRRLVSDLDETPYPTRPVVSSTRQVHERVAVEISRGCTRGCRFCQAGMTGRPVRERSPEKIRSLAERSLRNTGYDEVSLVSLSACDHSRATELVDLVSRRAQQLDVSVALPSLRLDSFSLDLASRLVGPRRTGLTFAPEVATDRMRALINKQTTDEQLLDLAEGVYGGGWNHLKLYFMIGLPGEQDADVEAIADLCLRTLARGRKLNRRARLNLGISSFVPKPWTPLQWAPQLQPEETRRRQLLLARALGRNKAIRFGKHDAEESWLEGLITRGDRRVADVIERAWRLGCRFDAWGEHRRIDLWRQAIEEEGWDPQRSLRARALEEPLPWDVADPLISRDWLRKEWGRAQRGAALQDCRSGPCGRCGTNKRFPKLCEEMQRAAPPVEFETSLPSLPRRQRPDPVQRLILRTARMRPASYLSNRDMLATWIRALRRARVPLAFSQGFHAHPRVALSSALPVGEDSLDDYLDLLLVESRAGEDLLRDLSQLLPEGLFVLGSAQIGLREPSLMATLAGLRYGIRVPLPREELAERLQSLLDSPQLIVTRRTKKGPRRRDLRPALVRLVAPAVAQDERGRSLVLLQTGVHPAGEGQPRWIRPRDLLELMKLAASDCRVSRLRSLRLNKGQLEDMGHAWGLGDICPPLDGADRTAHLHEREDWKKPREHPPDVLERPG